MSQPLKIKQPSSEPDVTIQNLKEMLGRLLSAAKSLDELTLLPPLNSLSEKITYLPSK